MANCPSAVAGASTELAMSPGGVDLTITAATPDAQQQPFRRHAQARARLAVILPAA